MGFVKRRPLQMKIIFAGTPDFAAEALRALMNAGHEIVAVLTQPDRPAGRGMHLQASPVKLLAQEKNIPVWQPLSLNIHAHDPQKQQDAKEALAQLMQIQFDVMVVVAYGLILPSEVLQVAERDGRFACFNIHASLLPRWRGAAPIQRAIEAGDTKTGVAIMKMEAGLDTGPVLISKELEISPVETSQSLHDRLAKLGGDLIVEALSRIASGDIHLLPQSKEGLSYANKILKAEALIDWHKTAQEIDRKVRAFNPFPVASTQLDGELIKIWRVRLPKPQQQDAFGAQKLPGSIVGQSAEGFWVQCKDQCLEILELQKPGGKKIPARTWFLANTTNPLKQFLSESHKMSD